MNAGIAGSITAGFQIPIKHSVSQPLINRNRPHMNTWKRPTGSSSRSDLLCIQAFTTGSGRIKTASTHDVANCHKVPAQVFEKHLCSIEETVTAIDATIHQLFHFNPALRIIFTISPVRHLRDGVVENNRSKARLIESVHHLVNKFDKLYYFPAYELVIDVLRDYRFYDIDLAHPNYAATQYVLEQFSANCFDPLTIQLMDEIKRLSSQKSQTF